MRKHDDDSDVRSNMDNNCYEPSNKREKPLLDFSNVTPVLSELGTRWPQPGGCITLWPLMQQKKHAVWGLHQVLNNISALHSIPTGL